jgi:hypothetical protein
LTLPQPLEQGRVLRELLPKSVVGARDTPSGRGKRNVARLCDLVQVHALHESQDEHRALVSVEPIHESVEGSYRFTRFGRYRRGDSLVDVLRGDQGTYPSASADPFLRGEHGDTRQPGFESARVLEFCDLLQRANEHVVQEVRSFGLAVPQHPNEDPLDVISVAVEQRGGGTFISLEQRSYEGRIVRYDRSKWHNGLAPLEQGGC